MVAAGDAIMGEAHVVKWPIAKILVLQRPDLDIISSSSRSSSSQDHSLRDWDWKKNKAEILLRYQRTPAVTCDRTLLLFSQSRTRGMCSVINHWR